MGQVQADQLTFPESEIARYLAGLRLLVGLSESAIIDAVERGNFGDIGPDSDDCHRQEAS